MSTGRPPIALASLDDEHQARCLKLRRRLTDQQALTFDRFLSLRAIHLLSWLYKCFPSLEGQLQRGALPAIMRCDPVVKMSPSSIHRGVLFDKRRLWVCTDTHLLVFREDGALKVQVAIADIAEVIHVRVSVPTAQLPQEGGAADQPGGGYGGLGMHSAGGTTVTSGGEWGKASMSMGSPLGKFNGTTIGGYGDDGSHGGGNSNNASDESDDDGSRGAPFVAHRSHCVCHGLVLRSPGKRDVGAYFGPSPTAVTLLIQYILNRRRVAIVNYSVKTGSTMLPPTAAMEAVVTRLPQPLHAHQLLQYLMDRSVHLKRPAGTAQSVTLSAPALPLITAASAAVEVSIGSTVYEEALREVEGNAARCREETADATCQLLVSSHLAYSALVRQALQCQHKTDTMAERLQIMRESNDQRHAAAEERLHVTREEIQRLAMEMLAMANLHAKEVQTLRDTCLVSDDRSKQSLDDTTADDRRTGLQLQQLTNEARYVEEQIAAQRAKLDALTAALPSAEDLSAEIAQLEGVVASIRDERTSVERSISVLAEETSARSGLVVTPRVGGSIARRSVDPYANLGASAADSPTGAGSSPLRESSVASSTAYRMPSLAPNNTISINTPAISIKHQEEVVYLEQEAMRALAAKREALDKLKRARIAHGNESILLERKKANCERLADRVTEALKEDKVLQSQLIDLRREVDVLERRIKLIPLETLLCDDFKRQTVIEASVERSVRLGAAPVVNAKSAEAKARLQIDHLNNIRDRMRSAVDRLGSVDPAAGGGGF